MKTIPLTKEKYAIVDDEDYDYLMQWKWYATKNSDAVRETQYGLDIMHRVILKNPLTRIFHKNGNPLDNRKANLVNPSERKDKKCYKCKSIKPLDQFNKNITNCDGRSSLCRACHKQSDKAYSIKTHNARMEYQRSLPAEYKVWAKMKDRCSNSNCPMYHRYGGRGISVCERWQSFDAFISDMGSRPTQKHQIDRIDNDGNYEPSNCRWVTPVENARNSSSTKLMVTDIKRIRTMFATGNYNQKQLRAIFPIGTSQMSRIVNHESWKEI